MAWGRNTRGTAPSPAAGKACQATKIYHCWYIFFGLQVCHLARTPAASCPCAYLTPWCRLPLGFGCRPAVPRAFHSTILLNRNSFLNHPADCGGNSTQHGLLVHTPMNLQLLCLSSYTRPLHRSATALEGKGPLLGKRQGTRNTF